MKDSERNTSDNFKFDLRLIERNLRDGIISKNDYEKALKDIPDESHNVRYIEVFEEDPVADERPDTDALTFTSG